MYLHPSLDLIVVVSGNCHRVDLSNVLHVPMLRHCLVSWSAMRGEYMKRIRKTQDFLYTAEETFIVEDQVSICMNRVRMGNVRGCVEGSL